MRPDIAPKEHQQHLELAAFCPKIAVACTQIATISTDGHHEPREFRASAGAQLREAWDAGDPSAFHGWSKWSPERVAAARSES